MKRGYEWGVATRDPLTGAISDPYGDPDWNEADARLRCQFDPNKVIVRRPVGKWKAVG